MNILKFECDYFNGERIGKRKEYFHGNILFEVNIYMGKDGEEKRENIKIDNEYIKEY